MAAIRISQLAEVTSVTNDDVFVINDGDVNTRKITFSNLTAGLVPKVGTTTIDGGLTLTGALTSQDLLVDGGTLFVDSTNDRVGVGTQAPQYRLDVDGSIQVRTGQAVRFNDPNNAYAVALQAPVLTATNTYALPNAFPTLNGAALTSTTAGVMSWSPVFTDPLLTVGDMVYRDATDTTTRLPAGLLGQVLTIQGDGTPDWQNPATGFADPMTNGGDIIIRNASNATTRLGIGLAGQVLTCNGAGTEAEWATPAPPATPTLNQVATAGALTGVNISVGNIFTVQGSGTSVDGAITLNCSQNTHGVTIKSPPHASAANYTLILPDDTGTNGQALTTDGSGNLSWASGSASEASSFTWNATLLPDTTEAYDLGSASFKVRHLYLSDNSIKFASGDLGVTSGDLTFDGVALLRSQLAPVLAVLGVSSFVDNAAAVAGGLSVGDIYYNGTDLKLTTVTA